jgi:hypothetical protein
MDYVRLGECLRDVSLAKERVKLTLPLRGVDVKMSLDWEKEMALCLEYFDRWMS